MSRGAANIADTIGHDEERFMRRKWTPVINGPRRSCNEQGRVGVGEIGESGESGEGWEGKAIEGGGQ